jgi:chemotaxis protein methyltransferase CheR
VTASGPEDVERFRALVERRLGLHFDDVKLASLADVLRLRLEATRCAGYDAYEARFFQEPGRETRALAEQLTIGETYFFRYGDHFRALGDVVLPESSRERHGGRRLHVLSAGCASGEEAYSLAILASEHLVDRSGCDLRIEGVDVNPAAIERARRARYSAWSLRETPPDVRARWFRSDGRDFELDDTIRASVSFAERNLVDDDPSFWRPGAWDVVFCRNVLMYFGPETMRAVVARIHRSLAPGGFLFLGHAETLRGTSQDFHLLHTHDTFYYRRREACEAPEPGWSVPPTWTSASRASSETTPLSLDSQDGSWVDAIHRSADRIAQLERSSQARASEPPGPGRFDLRPAVEALRNEHFADAMAHVRALPTGSENDLDALLLRAVLLTNASRLDEAEQVCATILRADELNAGAHYLMALCREHAADRHAALDHDQTAAYLDPGFAMPHLHLGLLARRAGDVGQARTELGRALEMLAREDASRILLFGGGFSREALVALCRSELAAAGGRP